MDTANKKEVHIYIYIYIYKIVKKKHQSHWFEYNKNALLGTSMGVSMIFIMQKINHSHSQQAAISRPRETKNNCIYYSTNKEIFSLNFRLI